MANERNARRITLIYAVISGAWIILTDLLAAQAGHESTGSQLVHSAKGLFFVVATGGILYWLLRKEFKRQHELDQRAQSERLALLDALPGQIAMLDSTGRIITANQAWNDMIDHIGAEFTTAFGKICSSTLETAAVSTGLQSVLSRQQPQFTTTLRHESADKLCWRQITITRTAAGENLLVTQTDITQQQQTAEKLRRADRALLVLGEANRALIHATEPAALLQELCRIVVERGGYPFAWAGGAENDGQKTMRPLAGAGLSADYLRQATISWGDNEHGQGPCSRVIRSGKPAIYHDLQTHPGYVPWREEVTKHAYHSAMSLPLTLGNGQPASLTIYAREKDAFDSAEESLLEQLAEDIRFGLRTLQQQTALREREATYRLLVEQSGDGVVLYDSSANILEANAAACRLTGYSHDELIGRSVKMTYVPEEIPQLAERVASASRGEISRYERKMKRKDGSIILVEVTLASLTNGCFQGTFRDITERRAAENALAESEGRHRSVLAALNEGVLVYDQSGRITYANDSAANILDLPENTIPGRALGKFPLMIVREDGSTCPVEEYPASMTLRSGQPVANAKLGLRRPDGTTRWLSLSSEPVRHAVTGQLRGVALSFFDITQQRASEEEARLFQHLAENTRDPLYLLDPADGFRLTYVNNAACQHFGLSREQLLQMRVPDWNPDFGPERLASLWKQIVSQKSLVFETRHRRSTGEIIPVEISTNHLVYKEHEYSFGYIRDVSERQRADQTLRESESRFRQAILQAPIPIMLHAEDGEVLAVSRAWTELTGYKADELGTVKDWTVRAYGEKAKPVDETIQKLFSLTSRVDEGEFDIRTAAGRILKWNFYSSPLDALADGRHTVISMAIDVTERRQLEAQYLHAQRMESIGTLAGGIAHDLNNILAPIIMSIQLLQEDSSLSEDSQNLLSTIDSCAHRGADVVRQVLTFARGIKGNRVLLQPRHLVKEMVKIAQETFPRNITIVSQTGTDTKTVFADPTQLHQVLLNLSINARDAMPEGGTLTFAIRNLAVDDNYTAARPEVMPGEYVLMTVTDTGEGMPPEVLKRCFEPFYTTKEQGKGTGLGLPTVLGIVRSHSGHIRVESEPGRGSRFEILLPASDAAGNPETAHNLSTPLIRGNGECILVVDDEEAVCKVTEATLVHNGYRVLKACDGTDAISVFVRNQTEIRAVLTDLMMPVLDGLALSRALLKLKPGIPIIASSGLGTEAMEEKLRQANVRHFLPKPYNAEKLLETLKQVLADAKGNIAPNS